MLAADVAVDVVTQLVKAQLASTRRASEVQFNATEQSYLKLEQEIVSLRNEMRRTTEMARVAAVNVLSAATHRLETVTDPAVQRKQQAIMSKAVAEFYDFRRSFDARWSLLAQEIYGAAWKEHVDFFGDPWGAFGDGWRTGRNTALRAIGNAGIDTGWGLVTFGFGNSWEVFDTSGEGYATSYMFARGGFELLAGLGIGKLATAPGTLGKAAFAVDVSGNVASVARGGYGVYKDGELNFADGAQLLGGGAGLVGNFAGALKGPARALANGDDILDGTKGIDDVVHAEFLDDAISFAAKNPAAAQIESILENAPKGSAGKELYAQVRELLAGTDDLSAVQKAAIFEAASKRINEIDSSWSATRGFPTNAFAIFMGEARPFGFLVDHQGGIWTIKDFFNSGGFDIFTGIIDFS